LIFLGIIKKYYFIGNSGGISNFFQELSKYPTSCSLLSVNVKCKTLLVKSLHILANVSFIVVLCSLEVLNFAHHTGQTASIVNHRAGRPDGRRLFCSGLSLRGVCHFGDTQLARESVCMKYERNKTVSHCSLAAANCTSICMCAVFWAYIELLRVCDVAHHVRQQISPGCSPFGSFIGARPNSRATCWDTLIYIASFISSTLCVCMCMWISRPV
jgi:hypothetical protein